MKKKLLFLITTFSVVAYPNKYSFLEKKDMPVKHSVADEYSLHISEEYQANNYNNISQEDIMSEYEEHVVDNAKPPVVSQPVAFLTHLGCVALIKYIALQEKAKIYFAELKNVLNNLFSFVIPFH